MNKVLPDIHQNLVTESGRQSQFRTLASPHDYADPSQPSMNSSLSRARDNSFHNKIHNISGSEQSMHPNSNPNPNLNNETFDRRQHYSSHNSLIGLGNFNQMNAGNDKVNPWENKLAKTDQKLPTINSHRSSIDREPREDFTRHVLTESMLLDPSLRTINA